MALHHDKFDYELDNSFIDKYFDDHHRVLMQFLDSIENRENLKKTVRLLKSSRSNAQKIYLIGNGGSAGIAEHMAVDLTKNAKLAATTFSGSPILTALANDYGYDQVFSRCIESYCNSYDILIAISSGGKSPNIIKACEEAKKKSMSVITFTGFGEDNPIRVMGDINFWVNSRSYGYVELIHNLLIHFINDAMIGGAVY